MIQLKTPEQQALERLADLTGVLRRELVQFSETLDKAHHFQASVASIIVAMEQAQVDLQASKEAL